jgi:hypothetical protein
VQEAAGFLIGYLIDKGDFQNAERFAEQTYANLRDVKNEMDPLDEEVDRGAYNLADVIYRQNGDMVKAEVLAREALRIRTLVCSSNFHSIGISSDLLARILLGQDGYGDETKKLFGHSLAIFIRNEGMYGANTATGNLNLGTFYLSLAKRPCALDSRQNLLLKIKLHCTECLRIRKKIYGLFHPLSSIAETLLSAASEKLLSLPSV